MSQTAREIADAVVLALVQVMARVDGETTTERKRRLGDAVLEALKDAGVDLPRTDGPVYDRSSQ